MSALQVLEVDAEFLPVLELEMHKDGHGVPDPTHVITDGDLILGAFSVAYAPCLFFWMHSDRGSGLTSFRAFKEALAVLEGMGFLKPILLIERKSPFYPYLERLGYGLAGSGEVWMRAQ